MTTALESIEMGPVGTPQGGIISPLLCNVALNGIEKAVLNQFKRDGVKFIRYADDILVCSSKYSDIIKSKNIISEFIKPIGLELSDEKTQICHSLGGVEGLKHLPVGVEYLGFYFKNITVSKYKGVKSTRGGLNTVVQISMPSLSSVKRHKDKLKHILRLHKSSSLKIVISALARVIRGWTTYFAVTKNCSKIFGYLDA
jgi:RNA-directed DNA polymerase